MPAEVLDGALSALVASGLAAFAIMLGLHRETSLPRPIATPLAGLGRISFGIYLWHWPLIVIWDTATLWERMGLESLGLAIAAILMGLASFLLIERPAQRAGRDAPLPALALSAVAALFAALMAFSIAVSAGAPQRLPDAARGILSETQRAHDRIETCHIFSDTPEHKFPVKDSCRHNAEAGPINTAVLGDSHSMTLAGGLARAGLPFVEHSYSGCAPTTTLYPETHGPACPERVEAVLKEILSDPQIETVIVAVFDAPMFVKAHGAR
jgi:hypothetical protein